MMVKIHITRKEIKYIHQKYKYVIPGLLKLNITNTGIDKILIWIEYRNEVPNIPNGKADNIIDIVHNTTHIFHPNEIDDFTLYDNGR